MTQAQAQTKRVEAPPRELLSACSRQITVEFFLQGQLQQQKESFLMQEAGFKQASERYCAQAKSWWCYGRLSRKEFSKPEKKISSKRRFVNTNSTATVVQVMFACFSLQAAARELNTRGIAWHRKYEQKSLEIFEQEKAAEAIPKTFQGKAHGQHTRGRSCGKKFQQPTRSRSLSLEYQTLHDSIPSLQDGALDKAMAFQAQLAES